MLDTEEEIGSLAERAARNAIIQSFSIRRLYGYRTIGLRSDHAATILIARNGTGKTTLLGALDAFLRLQFSRLANLEFESLECELSTTEEPLVLTHSDLDEFLQVPTEGDLVRLASRAGVEPAVLFKFLTDTRGASFYEVDEKIYSTLATSFAYKHDELTAALTKARNSLFARNANIDRIAHHINAALSEYEIVYLPTYRRVELALLDDEREISPYRRRRRPKLNIDTGSLFTGDIQFGLSDISDRLAMLNQQIIVESNNGYREISANIINELLDGALEDTADVSAELPAEEELRLFFSRLRESRRMGHYPPVAAPDLEKLYAGEGIAPSSQKFLKYFLSKLNTVIRAAKQAESPVDDFILKCNKYLTSSEPSTVLEGDPRQTEADPDSKILKLNRTNLKVHVESVSAGRKISLDSLSSGEKQMVSLFAKLFLYPKEKIVLIDEPELSLSIDWQAQILVDVLAAPLCRQIVAITHSPFVFDNELEPFARSLDVAIEERGEEEGFGCDERVDEDE